ncbi:MAG: BON domain-containing protein [Bacteroidota bacterium]|nr:BON domain-containing protein [Bacteroidota bacterium]
MEQAQQPDDLHMQATIIRLLQDDPKTDASKMEVVVKDANVLLKGRADTEEEKKHATQIARSVPGVKSVENHLHIEAGIVHALSAFAAQIMSSSEKNKDTDKGAEK